MLLGSVPSEGQSVPCHSPGFVGSGVLWLVDDMLPVFSHHLSSVSKCPLCIRTTDRLG